MDESIGPHDPASPHGGRAAAVPPAREPGQRRPLEPLAYDVRSRKGERDDGSRSRASAEVLVGGEILRGEAVGAGPVDALEKALRRALLPAFPWLEQLRLTDFRAQIEGGPAGERMPVQVRITATAPGVPPLTRTASSGDLLHAAWLAIGAGLEHAVTTGAGRDGAPARAGRAAAMTVENLAAILRPTLRKPDRAVLRAIQRTDWRTATLDLLDPADVDLAVHAAQLGAAVFYGFGNFCALAAHPRLESVHRVNVLKGRPINQVGSVTTTGERFELLFDWDRVPAQLGGERVLALMDDFFELGPMGFRGPAVRAIPDHLSSLDATIRTTQIIAPGYRCPSNAMLDSMLAALEEDYLFITSANVSGGATGTVQPAHYDLAGIQQDFGDGDGIVLIGHGDEAAVRASYPSHLPMSTSILAFHKLGHDEEGGPAMVLERHGSLHVDVVRSIVERHGFGLVLADGARERLPMRALPASAP
jgi:tRNA A37 threonylcarbamoyladenosine synthetase subunit TsaC/SUA5/YrdC